MDAASVFQWVKRWAADLAVPCSIFAGGGNRFRHKLGSNAHSFSLSPFHRLGIILERSISDKKETHAAGFFFYFRSWMKIFSYFIYTVL